MRSLLFLAFLIGTGCNDPAQFNGDAGSRQTGKELIPTPPPTKPCSKEAVEPSDTLFLLDNSGSMAAADPQRARLATIQDTVSTMTSLVEEDMRSQIQFSIRVFTPKDRGGTDTYTLTDWQAARDDAPFWGRMQANLPPADGDTPYRNAIAETDRAFNELDETEQKRMRRVLFITDGDPTDRDPRSVRAAYQLSKEAGAYEWITVFIRNGKSLDARRINHGAVMNEYENHWQKSNESTWRVGFTSDQDYVDNLMNLARDISDSYYEVEDSAGLRKLVAEEIVQKKILKCED